MAWGMIHGITLLFGVIAATLGFVAGLMYLVHSYRLKHKLPPRQGLRLPSLEWLQRANKRALIVSPCLLGLGLLSGVVMNVLKFDQGMAWTDPVVWTSGVLLFGWLWCWFSR
jgi:ABC-type transport system involved in cytochrome c biogenesis permease subunit